MSGAVTNHTKLYPEHVAYGAVLRSMGYSWTRTADEVNKVLEREGTEPVLPESLRTRVLKWEKQHGKAYGSALTTYLTDFSNAAVLRYILSELLLRYELEKFTADTKTIMSMGSKIMEIIKTLNTVEKDAGVSETEDAFAGLFREGFKKHKKPTTA